MTTDLTIREPTLPGLLPNVEAINLANSFGAALDGSGYVVARMPTLLERQVLSSRSSAIERALRPIRETREDRAAAGEAIAGLLVGYGYARNDPAAEQTIAVYVKHLETIPLFAVVAACEDVRAGLVYDVERRTGNRIPLSPDKEPSTIRLRAVAQKHVDKLADEKYRFDRVLRANRTLPAPIGEAERAVVADKFKELQADMVRRAAASGLGTELTPAEREKLQAARAAAEDRRRAAAERLIVGEYEGLGLAPVRSPNGILISLAMMLSNGWVVRETAFAGQIRRELISPAREAAP